MWNPGLKLPAPEELEVGGRKGAKKKKEMREHWELVVKEYHKTKNESIDSILHDNLASFFSPKFDQKHIQSLVDQKVDNPRVGLNV